MLTIRLESKQNNTDRCALAAGRHESELLDK